MINCLKCYHCKRIGDKIYCPFFDINPCHRGKHIIILPKGERLQPKPKPKPAKKKHLKFSTDTLTTRTATYKHRKFIFESVMNGVPFTYIASKLNIKANTISAFVHRNLERNNVKLWDLKNCIID